MIQGDQYLGRRNEKVVQNYIIARNIAEAI